MSGKALDPSVLILKSLNEDDQISVIREIGRNKKSGFLPQLIDLLPDSTGGLREAIVDALSAFGGKTVVKHMVKLLWNENCTARNDAIEIIENIGSAGMPVLIPLLSDPDENIRKFVVDIMGNIADPEPVEELIRLLQDPDVNVRAAAAESHGKIRDPRAVEHLVNMLSDNDWVMMYVIEALENFDNPEVLPQILPLINNDNPMIALSALKTIGSAGDETIIPSLAELLGEKSEATDAYIIQAISEILQKMDVDFTPEAMSKMVEKLNVILENLENEDEEVSEQAAYLLSKIQSPESVDSIVRFCINKEEIPETIKEILSHPDKYYTKAILEQLNADECPNYVFFIEALGNSRNEEVLDYLYNLLKSDSEEIRIAAVNAIGSVGKQAGGKNVIPMLKDPVGHVRRTSARCLGELKCKKSIPALLETLSDVYEDVRMEAAKSLLLFDENEYREKIVSLLEEKNENQKVVALFIVSKLKSIGDFEEKILNLLQDMSWKVRKYAVSCLEPLESKAAVDNLILALDDDSSEVKMRAINVLCRKGLPESLEVLLPLLTDKDVWVRYETARGLRHFNQQEAKEALMRCLEDESPVVQVSALESLEEYGGEDVISAAEKLLDSPDFEVRDAAEQILFNLQPGGDFDEPFGE
ncbi:MAG: HEAT repeat domain-containing protein [Firmicutes bacterium]|nr:HEAT repeat domain-containing protein [Bacillota bacterium]